MSGRIVVDGMQGHSAYPHLADNPVHGLVELIDALLGEPFDAGTASFQPTNCQVTSIDTGNRAVNVIPGEARAVFNIRFNDLWDEQSLKREIVRRLDLGSRGRRVRQDAEGPVRHTIEWIGRVSPVFLTRDNRLTQSLSDAIEAVTGRQPRLATNGGTSDARFIKDYCPVVDFGLVGQTMHQTDERVALADLATLTAIYERFIDNWFG